MSAASAAVPTTMSPASSATAAATRTCHQRLGSRRHPEPRSLRWASPYRRPMPPPRPSLPQFPLVPLPHHRLLPPPRMATLHPLPLLVLACHLHPLRGARARLPARSAGRSSRSPATCTSTRSSTQARNPSPAPYAAKASIAGRASSGT